MVNGLEALLQNGSVLGIFLALGIGTLTSLNPCFLSILPLLIGYLGGYSGEKRFRGFSLSFVFVLGLAITFSLMGLVSASLGLVFGQGLGKFWPYLTGLIAIIMGLNLLGLFNLNFPGLNTAPRVVKGYGGAFLLGLTFGFVASPCATPVLAIFLTFMAGTGEPIYGGLVLFAYGFGQGVPLIIIGTFTSIIKNLEKAKSWGDLIKKVSGLILVLFGVYLLLNI